MKDDTARGEAAPKLRRSVLPKDAAQRRYLELAQQQALEQIRHDAAALKDRAIAVGPFARIDAGAVAARDGKTRGAITNLFGSQAAFQAATMRMALDATDWIAAAPMPDPARFPDGAAWADALFGAQAARGPRHASGLDTSYASLWTLWLSTVPYAIWSEEIAGPAIEEYRAFVSHLEAAFACALAHFGLTMRVGVELADLACATASLIEGVWLNQCLSDGHPCRPGEPAAAALVRGGRLIWRGAVVG